MHGTTPADAGPAIKSRVSLEEWLDLLRSGFSSPTFIDYHFLSKEHYDVFISQIAIYPESDVLLLLERFLPPSGTLGSDELSLYGLVHAKENDLERYQRMRRHSFIRRLEAYHSRIGQEPPWQGITWVIDLLPHSPRKALDVLGAYFFAHAVILPDGRINGLSDAMGIIRARYIGAPASQPERVEFLKQLDSHDFECLVESLYSALGYKATLTPRTADGGRDIVATQEAPGKAETIFIECKRYASRVGSPVVRSILGAISDGKVNKGVIVTSGHFTRHAKELAANNPRIELISGEDLVPLLNEHLGANWVTKIDSIVLKSKSRIVAPPVNAGSVGRQEPTL